MSIQPQGEDLRKAVKWIAEERTFQADKDVNALAHEAAARFNLSPKDTDFLLRLVREKRDLDP